MNLFLLDTVRDPKDAGSIHRWELVKQMSKLGVQMYVISNEDIKDSNITSINLPSYEQANLVKKFITKFRFLSLLFIIPRKYNIDYLYTRNGLIASIGFLLVVGKKIKLVYEVNGISSDEKKSLKLGYRNIIKHIHNVFLITVDSFAASKADCIIAVTEGIKEHLVNKGVSSDKIHVINNGTNVDLFYPLGDSDYYKLEHLIIKYNLHNTYVIMFVGSLMPWQGVEHLINAAPLVIKEYDNVKFLIVGNGTMENTLKEQVVDNGLESYFLFTGNIDYADIPLHINVADICVVPKNKLMSGYSPLKLYEYMACAKPVIATNTAGFEVVEQSKAGFLVNPSNAHELSNSILKLLSNESLRINMGKNGRLLVTNKFSWFHTVNKIKEILYSCD